MFPVDIQITGCSAATAAKKNQITQISERFVLHLSTIYPIMATLPFAHRQGTPTDVWENLGDFDVAGVQRGVMLAQVHLVWITTRYCISRKS